MTLYDIGLNHNAIYMYKMVIKIMNYDYHKIWKNQHKLMPTNIDETTVYVQTHIHWPDSLIKYH